jgi:hypothetical protein
MKIFLDNNSYKSVRVTPDLNMGDLAKKMAEKINMDVRESAHLDIYEFKKEIRMSLLYITFA